MPFVDNYCYTSIEMMKSRSQLHSIYNILLPRFIHTFQNKIFCSDSGGRNLSSKFQKTLKVHRIIHETPYPYIHHSTEWWIKKKTSNYFGNILCKLAIFSNTLQDCRTSTIQWASCTCLTIMQPLERKS